MLRVVVVSQRLMRRLRLNLLLNLLLVKFELFLRCMCLEHLLYQGLPLPLLLLVLPLLPLLLLVLPKLVFY